jgi:hypothetical protein
LNRAEISQVLPDRFRPTTARFASRRREASEIAAGKKLRFVQGSRVFFDMHQRTIASTTRRAKVDQGIGSALKKYFG